MSKSTATSYLIQNMSQSEKRYFSLINKHTTGKKNYLKLFNLLDKKPDATNSQISAGLKSTSSNIAQDKAYLEWQLLRSLRQFHEEHSFTIQLQNTLSEIEVLFNKRLFDLCTKMIKQSKTSATTGDFFAHHLQLIEWEQRCTIAAGDMDYFRTRHQHLFDEEQSVLKKMGELTEIKREKTMLMSIFFTTRYLGEKNLSAFRAALKKSEKRKLSSITSNRAKLQQLEMMFLGYQYLMDTPNAMKYCRQGVEFFHNQPRLIAYHLSAYCAFMANFISGCIQLGNLDEALSAIEKYEQIANLKGVKPSLHLIVEMQMNSSIYKLMIYSAREEFKKGLTVIDSTQKYFLPISKHKRKEGLVLFIYYAAYFNLFNKQPGSCLDYLTMLFTEFKDEDRSDYFTCAHVMELMAHYDLKNWRVLPYKAVSVKRFLQSRGVAIKSPILIVRCFEQLEKLQPKQHRAAFEKLLQELEQLNTKIEESYFIETLMIREWLRLQL